MLKFYFEKIHMKRNRTVCTLCKVMEINHIIESYKSTNFSSKVIIDVGSFIYCRFLFCIQDILCNRDRDINYEKSPVSEYK